MPSLYVVDNRRKKGTENLYDIYIYIYIYIEREREETITYIKHNAISAAGVETSLLGYSSKIILGKVSECMF